jgi:hypothetical protein
MTGAFWAMVVAVVCVLSSNLLWRKENKALREELAQERADRTIKDGNGPTASLLQACNLHIEEIRRLEAERDALREQVESVRVANSERARKGWVKRKRAA